MLEAVNVSVTVESIYLLLQIRREKEGRIAEENGGKDRRTDSTAETTGGEEETETTGAGCTENRHECRLCTENQKFDQSKGWCLADKFSKAYIS